MIYRTLLFLLFIALGSLGIFFSSQVQANTEEPIRHTGSGNTLYDFYYNGFINYSFIKSDSLDNFFTSSGSLDFDDLWDKGYIKLMLIGGYTNYTPGGSYSDQVSIKNDYFPGSFYNVYDSWEAANSGYLEHLRHWAVESAYEKLYDEDNDQMWERATYVLSCKKSEDAEYPEDGDFLLELCDDEPIQCPPYYENNTYYPSYTASPVQYCYYWTDDYETSISADIQPDQWWYESFISDRDNYFYFEADAEIEGQLERTQCYFDDEENPELFEDPYDYECSSDSFIYSIDTYTKTVTQSFTDDYCLENPENESCIPDEIEGSPKFCAEFPDHESCPQSDLDPDCPADEPDCVLPGEPTDLPGIRQMINGYYYHLGSDDFPDYWICPTVDDCWSMILDEELAQDPSCPSSIPVNPFHADWLGSGFYYQGCVYEVGLGLDQGEPSLDSVELVDYCDIYDCSDDGGGSDGGGSDGGGSDGGGSDGGGSDGGGSDGGGSDGGGSDGGGSDGGGSDGGGSDGGGSTGGGSGGGGSGGGGSTGGGSTGGGSDGGGSTGGGSDGGGSDGGGSDGGGSDGGGSDGADDPTEQDFCDTNPDQCDDEGYPLPPDDLDPDFCDNNPEQCDADGYPLPPDDSGDSGDSGGYTPPDSSDPDPFDDGEVIGALASVYSAVATGAQNVRDSINAGFTDLADRLAGVSGQLDGIDSGIDDLGEGLDRISEGIDGLGEGIDGLTEEAPGDGEPGDPQIDCPECDAYLEELDGVEGQLTDSFDQVTRQDVNWVLGVIPSFPRTNCQPLQFNVPFANHTAEIPCRAFDDVRSILNVLIAIYALWDIINVVLSAKARS